MKKILFFSLFISLKMLGQSVELKPGSNGFVMIPNVSSLGACGVTDKGKIVYYSGDNLLKICNGTAWVSVSGTGLTLPYTTTQNLAGTLLNIENASTDNLANGIRGTTNSNKGTAIEGIAQNTTPTNYSTGIIGRNNSTNSYGYGVLGVHNGTGDGVRGVSDNGTGIYGSSSYGTAGHFYSFGGYALKTTGKLQLGFSNGTGKFLKSTSISGDAEWSDLLPFYYSGNSNNTILSVENSHTTANNSTIKGITSSGYNVGAVHGVATNNNPSLDPSGVQGVNNSSTSNGYGVFGEHNGYGTGVYGTSLYGFGVKGESYTNYGVHGIGGNIGVWGRSPSSQGVQGSSTSGIGGYFLSETGYALVTTTGNVGIGTATPTAKMDIKGSVKFSHFYYGANEDTYIRGGKAGSKVLINDEAGMGSVGIGLLNPNEILDVNGRMRIRHKVISTVPYTSGVWMSNSTNSLSDADGAFYGMKTDFETGIFIYGDWRFWVNGAGNGYLNGNLIQTSDQRLKKNFLPIKNSLSSIYKLNGYKFNWIEEARSRDLQTGLIAQEVQKIFPELVQTDEKGFLSVNYIGLVPHLIEAVKELRDENNSLKLNNQTLENKNQNLESRLDKIEAMLSTIQPNTENLNSKK